MPAVTVKLRKTCPHCGERLSRWETPPATSWAGAIHLVCFNDECPYFRKGWAHMLEKYEVHSSYRYRFDPENGAEGPLPVWSPEAMRGLIVEDDEDGASEDPGQGEDA